MSPRIRNQWQKLAKGGKKIPMTEGNRSKLYKWCSPKGEGPPRKSSSAPSEDGEAVSLAKHATGLWEWQQPCPVGRSCLRAGDFLRAWDLLGLTGENLLTAEVGREKAPNKEQTSVSALAPDS